MTDLIAQGNAHREHNNPEGALACYVQAMATDRRSAAAFNNYGNVLREVGEPESAVPFLQHAMQLDPNNVTAAFNLSVAWLLMGDYTRGWPQYETRWQYEHLAGLLPTYAEPRWTGQALQDCVVLVVGEQGHGDNIQFVRFVRDLAQQGARVWVHVPASLVVLFEAMPDIEQAIAWDHQPQGFDYWIPIMSIPAVLGTCVDTLPHLQRYLTPAAPVVQQWLTRLGAKKKLRVGFCWSGRRDTWINRHKAMPFERMCVTIQQHRQVEWICLQQDATEQELQILATQGVRVVNSDIAHFGHTAALIQCCDLVITVDTAVAHLAGAVGRPTWILLSQFAVDWRWLLGRNDSPWYPTARLFRQPDPGNWAAVQVEIGQYLSWFKA